MEEIFRMAREETRKSGFDGLLPAGIVVSGGGARLMGTTDAAQTIFDTSVRLGQPAGLSGLADRCQGPQYAVAVGLVRWGARTHHHPAHANGRQELTLATTYQKTVRWLRDFF
jgi:cell division protein FtsA